MEISSNMRPAENRIKKNITAKIRFFMIPRKWGSRIVHFSGWKNIKFCEMCYVIN